jgi:hypothetical protein
MLKKANAFEALNIVREIVQKAFALVGSGMRSQNVILKVVSSSLLEKKTKHNRFVGSKNLCRQYPDVRLN